jgi:hypothetical protein
MDSFSHDLRSLSSQLQFSILGALLTWETYVNIAKASEIDDKSELTNKTFRANITLTKVPK